MKYMGSKNRIAKHILPIMLKEMEDKGYTTWVEPFVGGGNMIDKVPDKYKRIGADLNEHTIAAMLGIRDFVNKFPESLSEDGYKRLIGKEPHPVHSWLRFVASFGGRMDEGYAREKMSDESTFVGYGKRNAIKQSPKIQDVSFICCSYKDLSHITDALIYCDPPYAGTKWYRKNLVPKLDHMEFFDWCRDMKAKGNSVFVSEYNAPDDFELVWQGGVKTNFSSTRKAATHNAVEKLFKV